jgi:ribonuclease D
MSSKLPPYTYISDAETLRWLAVELSQQSLLALDTESNSLHAYKEQVCLIQLSTREADYIIDPLAIDDLSPLGVLLADPTIEIVFHAAEYDLMTLKRDFDFQVTHLFDTMLAARIVGYASFGLAALLKKHFGVKPNKKHQLDNWGRRPLPEESLSYAQMDTHFLPTLRDILQNELEEVGRLAEAFEIFAEAVNVPAADNSTDYEGYWNIGRPNDLTSREMAILREVFLLREEIAEDHDLPTFKVLSNRALVNIARSAPSTLRQLSDVREMPGVQVRRYGDEILEAIQRGKEADIPQPPPLPTPPRPEIADRFVVLQQWRKEKGIERGVASDVVLAKDVLWELARIVPQSHEELEQINGIGPQRLRLYGDDLLRVMSRF